MIGTLANAIGRAPAFSLVVVIALALIAETRRLPSSHVRSEQGFASLLPALAGRGVALAMWLVALPAIAAGALDVLAPLRLHRFGAGTAAVGATFLLAAVAEAARQPRRGPRLRSPRADAAGARSGSSPSARLLLCFSLPGDALALALVVVATGGALGGFWAPAMALLSDAAERHGSTTACRRR